MHCKYVCKTSVFVPDQPAENVWGKRLECHDDTANTKSKIESILVYTTGTPVIKVHFIKSFCSKFSI